MRNTRDERLERPDTDTECLQGQVTESVQVSGRKDPAGAPGAAVAQMVEAILKDKNLIVPAATYMQGEYGLKDIFFGAPVQLGRSGVVKIIEYQLNDEEAAAMNKSANAVNQTIQALQTLVKF